MEKVDCNTDQDAMISSPLKTLAYPHRRLTRQSDYLELFDGQLSSHMNNRLFFLQPDFLLLQGVHRWGIKQNGVHRDTSSL